MKVNIYTIVFGIVGVVLLLAGFSIFFFNQTPQPGNANVVLQDYGPAPNIQGISGWINSNALNISQLRGKVVLIDFWTYSCINCIRSIPHLNAWYSAYGNSGLVIVGVSTPEFQFEHNYSNVYNAVKQFGIKFPVALDNNYSTWDAYNNHYWPADYLVDTHGNIQYITFGEGDYNQTELAIRKLLQNAGYSIQPNLTNVALGVNFSMINTPEIYLGWARARSPLGNAQGFVENQTINYTKPNTTLQNTVYLSGNWYNSPDGMVAVNDSKLFLTYSARNVNIVASGNSTITVKLDGNVLPRSDYGADDSMLNGNATAKIGPSRLYVIVNGTTYGTHQLEIDASPGFKLYTFTFG